MDSACDEKPTLQAGEDDISPHTSSFDSCSEGNGFDPKRDLTPLDNNYNIFRGIWPDVTSDNRLTLFGFRRYRTAHLLNLRFLEAEIDRLDHELYQAGLQLNYQPGTLDRLGLKHAKRDAQGSKLPKIVNESLVLRLRALIKEYDEALASFNTVMTMETFSLADNIPHSVPRTDLHAFEKFKTRMVRVDLPLRRSSRDPIQHYLRKGLRRLWYYMSKPKLRTDDEEEPRRTALSTMAASWDMTYQNTSRVAEFLSRFTIALIAGTFLVAPVILLSWEQSQESRLLIVGVCIVIFCFIVALLSKASNYEAMAAAAAYAAVLTVFLSNGPIPQ